MKQGSFDFSRALDAAELFVAWAIFGWLGIFAPLVFVAEAANKSYEEWKDEGRFALLSLVLGVLWIVAAVVVLANIQRGGV